MTAGDGRRLWALVLLGLVAVEFASVLVGTQHSGMTFAIARDSFMITSVVVGVCCTVCGLLIAWHRPENRLGWILLAAGVTQTGTAAVTPWLVQALQSGASDGLSRPLSTIYSMAWPWSVSLFIPLALLHFPDGRLPDSRWRWTVPVLLVNGVLQVLLFHSDLTPLSSVSGFTTVNDDRASSWLRIPALTSLGWLWTVSDVVLGAAFLTGLTSLVVRYRRGDERTRRQLLWLLLATTVSVVVIVVSRTILTIDQSGFPIILTAFVALIPVSMAIAVLRYRLLDIRLVWSRTVTYFLLTAAVVAVYVGLVEVTDRLVRQQSGIEASVVATLLIAAGFHPVRARLQRWVDRLVYGDRADPVRAAASVTAHLATVDAQRPIDVLPAVCRALRLPYACLCDEDGPIGEHGRRPELVEGIALHHAGERLGELQVGIRSGQRRLDPADRAVLELVAVPIGVALRASALSDAVQLSRRAIVTAREEERRRLRRDLHDGLGPVLTGIAFQADAVINLAATDPHEVRALGESIRRDANGAIRDVRRLIYQLHPAALDELGLVEALRRHEQRLDRNVDGVPLEVIVTAEHALPDLPAAVEVAAYRIVTEAITNVARHSRASRAEVDLAIEEDAAQLTVRIKDDDNRPSSLDGRAPSWTPGVGLGSMRDRVAELGGMFVAGPTPAGGVVHARLPLGVSP